MRGCGLLKFCGRNFRLQNYQEKEHKALDRCYARLGTAYATIACDISEAEVGFAPFDAGLVHGFLEAAL